MKRVLIVLALVLAAVPAAAQSTAVSGYREDTPSINNENLMMMGGRRCNTASSSSSTNGNRVTFCIDANGRVMVNGSIYTPNGDSAMDDTADAVRVINVDAAGNPLSADTQLTFNASTTWTGATGAAQFYRGASSAPTAVTTDRPVLPWGTLAGALNTALTFGDVAAATGNGAANAQTQRKTEATDSQLSVDTAAIKTAVQALTTGASNYSFLSTAAVLAASIKSTAGVVWDIQCFNESATPVYVRLYNQTSSPATTDTANIVWRGKVPGNTAGAGFTVPLPNGRAFSSGIGIRVTGAVADNDNTALSANVINCNVGYK